MSYPPREAVFIHPQADVDPTVEIGEGSKVWACVGILHDAKLGRNVNIGRCSEIGHGTTIGEGSRIGYNVFLPNNSVVGQYVFIGPNVTFCDDRYPKVARSWDKPYNALPPTIGDGAVVGAGCVILPGIKIGIGARIAAGSIVTKDVPNYCAVRGGPAKFFDVPEEWNPLNQLVKETEDNVRRKSTL